MPDCGDDALDGGVDVEVGGEARSRLLAPPRQFSVLGHAATRGLRAHGRTLGLLATGGDEPNTTAERPTPSVALRRLYASHRASCAYTGGESRRSKWLVWKNTR